MYNFKQLIMRKIRFWMLAAILICGTSVFTSCDELLGRDWGFVFAQCVSPRFSICSVNTNVPM